ncbi:MAG: DNA polymerase III subunit delta [Fimbriimonadaceae bacterium]|nr:DNA polymerase III subunit delta [Fimbriimonadaceae bacterium]
MSLLFDAGKALKHRAVILAADESALRAAALKSLVAALGDAEFDTESVGADEIPPADWLARAGTSPFLGERRTVIVRQLVRAGSPKDAAPDMVKRLKALPPHALLVFVADEENTSDESRRKANDKVRGDWSKVVKDGDGFVYDPKPDSRALVETLMQTAKERDRAISRPAAQLLVEMVGESYSRAVEELEKLILFVGDVDRITDKDVKEVVLPSPDWSVFKLIDAVFGRRPNEALRQLRMLMGGQGKADEAAHRNIVPMLSRQLRLVWQARVCVERNVSPSNPPDDVRAAFPSRPNLGAEKEWQQSRALQTARQTDLPKLARCFALLSDADASLKGALPGFSAMETMERMVLEMIEALSEPNPTTAHSPR